MRRASTNAVDFGAIGTLGVNSGVQVLRFESTACKGFVKVRIDKAVELILEALKERGQFDA
jgi:hypothetical protein